MGAHSTLHVSRTQALATLRAALEKPISRRALEDALDGLYYHTLYNFIVTDDAEGDDDRVLERLETRGEDEER